MRFGELTTLAHEGLILEPSRLEPFGIFNDSQCWCRWLPDRRSKEPDPPTPPHLVLSAYHPDSWPKLYRVELRLNTEPGSLASAARALADQGFTVLTNDCTPSGHSHLTWTVVGEFHKQDDVDGLATAADEALLAGGGFEDCDRHFENERLREFANERFAPLMLWRSRKLRQSIIESNARDNFLHNSFLKPERHFGGILYSESKLRPPSGFEDLIPTKELQKVGRKQQVRGVSCRWLGGLAFYWLYGRGSAFPLTYEKRASLLRARESSRGALMDEIDRWVTIPIRTLALFDTDEQYFRVLLSPADQAQKKVWIDLQYSATFEPGTSTSGALEELLKKLQDHRIAIKHISNRILARDGASESIRGRFVGKTMAGSPESPQIDLQTIQTRTNAKVSVGRFAIGKVSANTMFVSTRLAWSRLGELTPPLKDCAARAGMRVVMADQPPSSSTGITTDVIQQIRRSDALLQLIPQVEKLGKEKLQWMLFELGMAVASNIPFAICVDSRNPLGSSLPTWFEKLKVGSDWYLHQFNSCGSAQSIVAEFSKAVDFLAAQVRRSPD